MCLNGGKTAAFLGLGLMLLFGGCTGASERSEIPVGTVRTEEVSVSPEEVKTAAEAGVFRDAEKETRGETETETEKEVDCISEERYAYGVISDEAKTTYDEILSCILNHEEESSLSTLNEDIIGEAYNAVNADYGGLFWVEGYVYTKYSMAGQVTGYTFSPKYTMDREERDLRQKEIDAAVEDFLSGISISDSDYEKSKYVYETLIKRVDYDESAPDNQNILSVFLNQRTVCQGYADATQYLLTQLGIESVVVTGRTRSENHAWVAAKLDGDYYFIDTTFGNSLYSGNSDNGKYINHAYLNITGEELEMDHEYDDLFSPPVCTAVKDNYFRQEGLYFEEFLPDEIGLVFREGWESGRTLVSIKLSDTNLYDEVYEYFIARQRIGDYCAGITSFSYVDDPYKRVLIIGF